MKCCGFCSQSLVLLTRAKLAYVPMFVVHATCRKLRPICSNISPDFPTLKIYIHSQSKIMNFSNKPGNFFFVFYEITRKYYIIILIYVKILSQHCFHNFSLFGSKFFFFSFKLRESRYLIQVTSFVVLPPIYI